MTKCFVSAKKVVSVGYSKCALKAKAEKRFWGIFLTLCLAGWSIVLFALDEIQVEEELGNWRLAFGVID